MNENLENEMLSLVLEQGATKAGFTDTKNVVLNPVFRTICESNGCGNYGKCWMCPPDCGPIDELMAEIPTYDRVLVYQTIGEIEDSYDFEGMMNIADFHTKITQKVKTAFKKFRLGKILHLGAGGCHVCKVCAKKEGLPCRFPDKAIKSLEAYGINVSCLAKSCGMKYINGENTVTYFSAVFFSL